MQLENRLHNYQEAATVLGMKPSGLRRICAEGRGPAITKIGRLRRFRPDSLIRFLEERTERSE
jgi:hypothetical protein